MGARALLNAAKGKTDSLSRWALAVQQRRGYWKAVVAIAAKNARMAWAVLCVGNGRLSQAISGCWQRQTGSAKE